MSKNKDVTFRRIKGKIVPIKRKQDRLRTTRKIGGHAALAGLASAVVAPKIFRSGAKDLTKGVMHAGVFSKKAQSALSLHKSKNYSQARESAKVAKHSFLRQKALFRRGTLKTKIGLFASVAALPLMIGGTIISGLANSRVIKLGRDKGKLTRKKNRILANSGA